MKHLFLFLISLASLPLAYAQQNIKPSCRNHKSGIALRQPTAGELARMEAMAFRSDTFDITHYSIHLEEVNYGLKTIAGFCEVSFFARLAGRSDIHLDLLNLPVDSVKRGDQPLNFIYDSLMVHIYFDEELSVNDTQTVTIWYGGRPTLDPSGFGGFDFQDGYAYNLGIGLASIPHNFGRGWFPCFDNFVERATFDFYVTTETTKFAYCVGTHVATEALGNGKQRFHYRMEQPITTYHAAVAVADYALTRTFHGGLEKEIPVELVSKPQDTTKFRNSFAFLHEAIESLEQWYGPYPWERVGYVITTVGAMEHPTCIAYPASLGLNENPYNNMDIMSHELAHHWFGNVTTLTTAYDMWIKEGTSEYGYHLFTKDFLGDEEFYDLIADNQFDVLENAHRQDEDFRALSGMPMEFTYGMTTYQKGAAVMHNLHSYLGDSLFKVGVRTLLDDYAFSHCDAAEFEASFTQSTGKDMSDFFRDWIHAPGFSAFEIDSIHIEQTGSEYDITLFIEQKLWHAPHFHTKVPMTVTFIDDHRKKHSVQIELDGQYTEVNIRLGFHPAFQFLNDNSFLNNGQLSYDRVIGEDGKYNFRRSHLDIDATGVTDSFLLFVEHIWGAPDPLKRTDLDIDLSDNHYWIIDGISTPNARLSTRFYYAGNHKDELDYDLVGETEEEIILLYRRNSGEDWVEYPYAFKNIFIPTDKKGFFVVDSLLFGQYCFGNGNYFAVGTEDDTVTVINPIRITPNPANQFIDVSTDSPDGLSTWQLLDLAGRVVKNGAFSRPQFRIELYDLPAGTYTFQVYDKKGVNKGLQKLIKME